MPYVWTICADDTNASNKPSIIYRKPRLDVIDYIADADYLVQLSDNEGYCYSVVESLLAGTPVIVTDMPVMKEIGVVNGENGFIINFDMTNVPVNAIYNGLNKVVYKAKEDNWDKYLAKGKSSYKEEDEMKYKVRAIIDFTYDDYNNVKFLKKEKVQDSWVYVGDEFLCDEDQYHYLTGENRLRVNAVKLISVKEEKPKEEKKETKEEE